MARGRPKKSKPILKPLDDKLVDNLRDLAGKVANANAALETARAPLKAATAAVKGLGYDLDLFNTCRKIHQLEDDDQRRKRARQLRYLMVVFELDRDDTPDLIGEMPPAQAVVDELRAAADAMRDDGQDDGDGDDSADDRQFVRRTDIDGPGPDIDEPAIPALETVPEQSGVIFNAAATAYRNGCTLADNPFADGSAEAKMWATGWEAAANPPDDGDDDDADAAARRFVVKPAAKRGGEAVLCEFTGDVWSPSADDVTVREIARSKDAAALEKVAEGLTATDRRRKADGDAPAADHEIWSIVEGMLDGIKKGYTLLPPFYVPLDLTGADSDVPAGFGDLDDADFAIDPLPEDDAGDFVVAAE